MRTDAEWIADGIRETVEELETWLNRAKDTGLTVALRMSTIPWLDGQSRSSTLHNAEEFTLAVDISRTEIL